MKSKYLLRWADEDSWNPIALPKLNKYLEAHFKNPALLLDELKAGEEYYVRPNFFIKKMEG